MRKVMKMRADVSPFGACAMPSGLARSRKCAKLGYVSTVWGRAGRRALDRQPEDINLSQ